jgi:hypothetical protein
MNYSQILYTAAISISLVASPVSERAYAANAPQSFCQLRDKRLDIVRSKVASDTRKLRDVPRYGSATGNPPPQIARKQLAWDKITEDRIMQLEKIASSRQQKEAVRQFKEKFRAAVSAKRIANQADRSKHQDQVSASSSNHSSEFQANMEIRSKALANAAMAARNLCILGKDSDYSIQESYNKDIRKAQADFIRANGSQSKNLVQNLSQNAIGYKDDEMMAQQTYSRNLSKALDELKSSLQSK